MGYLTFYQASATALPLLLLAVAATIPGDTETYRRTFPVNLVFIWVALHLLFFCFVVAGEIAAMHVLVTHHGSQVTRVLVEVSLLMCVSPILLGALREPLHALPDKLVYAFVALLVVVQGTLIVFIV